MAYTTDVMGSGLMSTKPANMSPIGTDTTAMLEEPAYQGRPTTDEAAFRSTGVAKPLPAAKPVGATEMSVADKLRANVEAYRAENPVELAANDVGTAGVAVANTGTTSDALDDNLNASVGVATDTETAEETIAPHDQALANLFQAFNEQQEFDPAAIMKESGVYAQKERVNTLSKNYDTEVVNQRHTIQEMRKNPEGKLAGALEADIQNYKYESNQNLAEMAMELHYANADYEMVYNIAQDAINAQTDKFNQKLSFWGNMYSALKDNMTTEEKMMFESQLRQAEDAGKALMETKSTAMSRAAQANAPVEVMQAIKNAETPEEVWAAAGQYGADPSVGLAQDRFEWEQKKYWLDRALAQQLQAGEVTAQQAVEQSLRTQAVSKVQGELDTLNRIVGNTQGIIETAGTSRFGQGTFSPFSKSRAQLLADTTYLLNNKTFDKLAEITANTSLGAISEGELAAVKAAATRVGAFARYDDAGNVTHFEGAEEDVLAAFMELQVAAQEYKDVLLAANLDESEILEIQQRAN